MREFILTNHVTLTNTISADNAEGNSTKTVFSENAPTIVTFKFQPEVIEEGEKFRTCADVHSGGENFNSCEIGVNGSRKEPGVIQINLGK
jgi:hypothetical protein